MTSAYLSEEAEAARMAALVARLAAEMDGPTWSPDSDFWRVPPRVRSAVIVVACYSPCAWPDSRDWGTITTISVGEAG